MSKNALLIAITFVLLCIFRVQAQGGYDQTAINYAPAFACKGKNFFIETTYNKACRSGNFNGGSFGIEWLDVNTNTWYEYGKPECKLMYVDGSAIYEDENIFKIRDTLYFDPSLSGVQYIRARVQCDVASGFEGNRVAITIKTTPAAPEKIIGRARVGLDVNPAYLVKPVPEATSYRWSVTPNLIITAGQDTRSVNVSFASLTGSFGTISVKAQNACGCSEPITKQVSVLGNLINNPSFDDTHAEGGVGFSSNYSYSANLVPEGNYYIGQNAQLYNRGFVRTETSKSGDNFMIINGAKVAGLDVWKQNVQVRKNTYYIFQFSLSSLVKKDPANLQLYVNNVLVKDFIIAPETVNLWQKVSVRWYSGNQTNADLSIRNQNTIAIGNDFGIDDLYFGVYNPNADSSVNYAEALNVFYPNPIKRSSGQAVNFTLEEPGKVYIKVTDLAGNLIYQERKVGVKGANVLNFQAKDYRRGTYIITIQKNTEIQKHRLVIED